MTSSRRHLLLGFLGACLTWPAAATTSLEAIEAQLAALERRHGGRLGVAVFDSGSHRLIARRGRERFPMCSTHKLVSVAFVLARIDRGEESLARRIVYDKSTLVAYSPFTEKHVGPPGVTVGELCAAALTLSDNTAANLLLASFGGPTAWTTHARALGDKLSRLDRNEPDLNEARPGDPRDTTTPVAMLGILRKTVLGTALSAASRARLTAWLTANKTGDQRLRAGVPKGWRVGDKTGTGDHNTANDIALLWPPGRAPIVVTAYYTGSRASSAEQNAVLSEVGRLAAMV